MADKQESPKMNKSVRFFEDVMYYTTEFCSKAKPKCKPKAKPTAKPKGKKKI